MMQIIQAQQIAAQQAKKWFLGCPYLSFQIFWKSLNYFVIIFICSIFLLKDQFVKKRKLTYSLLDKIKKSSNCWSSWSSVCFGHSFDSVFMRCNVHDWNTRHFSDSSFQIFITSSNNVDSVLFNSFDNTVIGISSLMITFQSFKSWIFCDFESDSVLNPKLFQLPNNTIRNIGNTLPKQTIHRRFKNIQLILYRKVDKVGIQQNPIRWS